MKTRTWLAYSVLGLAGIGLTGVLPVTGSRQASRYEKQPSVAAVPQSAPALAQRSHAVDSATRARMIESVAKTPMSFEANMGQTDSRVKFLSRGLGYTLFLTPSEAVLALQSPVQKASAQPGKMQDPLGVGTLGQPARTVASTKRIAANEGVLRMRLVGANSAPKISGLEESSAKSNYYIGNDRSKWHTNVANFGKVQYAGIYPGVDVVYYGQQKELEYDFVVAPGADPGVIAIAFDGDVHSKNVPLRISEQGELIAHLAGGDVHFHKPVVYQTANHAQKQPVDGRYTLKADGKVGFELGSYDHSRQLVIDPVISFSSYLGGSNQDMSLAVAADRYQDVAIAGSTRSPDFPLFDSLETYHGGTCGGLPCWDIFVSKFSPTGAHLQYSTYIGGSSDDVGTDMVLDNAGDLFVVGYTLSTDFPVTTKAFQKTFAGGTVTGDGFFFELASKGIGLEYASYLGGTGEDEAYSVAVDWAPSAVPNIYVVGSTTSTNFPTTSGAFQRTCGAKQGGGCSNGFATKVNTKGTALLYSTYLGGSDGLGDAAYNVAVDSINDVYVTGITGSPNFPTTSGAFDTTCGTDAACNGTFDGFVTELNTTGTGLVYSTFLGGSGYDYTAGIAVDASGAAYVSGNTVSTDFPTTAGAAQTTFGGMSSGCSPTTGSICGDVTITKLNPAGATVAYSTYLGGVSDESPGMSMSIDAAGNAYVTGQTSSANFPSINALQPTFGGGGSDAFLAEVNATGSAFIYSTYLGGNGQDFGYRNALDPLGNLYVTGGTLSTNLPVKSGEFQTICGTDGTCNGGLMDAWVAKVITSADVTVANMSMPPTIKSGTNLSLTVYIKNNGPDAAATVVTTDAVPAGTVFVNAHTNNGTCTTPAQGGTGTVTCTAPTLAANTNLMIGMTVKVTAPAGSIVSNTASVTSTTFDPKKPNNTATKKTTVD